MKASEVHFARLQTMLWVKKAILLQSNTLKPTPPLFLHISYLLMATGRIPREFIDDLLVRADVVEVINARVPLKKKGREYTACCPFHNEKTPSFTVSPNKQFYHCFGCGVHGSALSFLMEYEHLILLRRLSLWLIH